MWPGMTSLVLAVLLIMNFVVVWKWQLKPLKTLDIPKTTKSTMFITGVGYLACVVFSTMILSFGGTENFCKSLLQDPVDTSGSKH